MSKAVLAVNKPLNTLFQSFQIVGMDIYKQVLF